MKHLSLTVIFALGCALAQIGREAPDLLRQLSPTALTESEGGYATPGGLGFRLEERGGLLYRLAGEAVMDEANLPFAAKLIGAATGYGAAIEEPLQDFFRTRLGELAGQGLARLDVQGYTLELTVMGEAPYEVSFAVSLPEVQEDAFPEAAHSLGPADAEYVIREFSDFQCPFCARFVEGVYPEIKAELLSRGDVRFEFHHFPLQSIHANALMAAEAAECVAAENGEDAFWTYHDALFARQQAWQDLSDPSAYFVRLAQDVGLETADLTTCLMNRTYAETLNAAYQYAGGVLRLTGTPTVFVNGYKLGDYTRLEAYLELMRLADAFSLEAQE